MKKEDQMFYLMIGIIGINYKNKIREEKYGKILVFFRFDKKLQKSLFYALAKLWETCYNNV